MLILSWICVVVGLVWVGYKISVSYKSFGGTVMVTVFDAAIYPPILMAFGLYWVLPSLGVDWPSWAFLLIWLGLVAIVAGLIKLAEELGDRPME